MPLHYNWSECENPDELSSDENAVMTDTMIFMTMHVGIPEITEKNWEHFAERMFALQATGSFITTGEGKPYYITREDVKRYIGLKTNASKLSIATFKTRVYGAAVAKGRALTVKNKAEA